MNKSVNKINVTENANAELHALSTFLIHHQADYLLKGKTATHHHVAHLNRAGESMTALSHQIPFPYQTNLTRIPLIQTQYSKTQRFGSWKSMRTYLRWWWSKRRTSGKKKTPMTAQNTHFKKCRKWMSMKGYNLSCIDWEGRLRGLIKISSRKSAEQSVWKD